MRQIARLQEQSGGFGAFLTLDTNWADWTDKKQSYELIARHVMPHFQGSNTNRDASLRWAADNRPRFIGEAQKAVGARVAQHVADKGSDNIRPEILAAMGLDKKPEAAE